MGARERAQLENPFTGFSGVRVVRAQSLCIIHDHSAYKSAPFLHVPLSGTLSARLCVCASREHNDDEDAID